MSELFEKILSGGNIRRILAENQSQDLTVQYPYNAKQMKVSRRVYDRLIKDWQDDLRDSASEEDMAYHNEFYLRQLYKKQYLPF